MACLEIPFPNILHGDVLVVSDDNVVFGDLETAYLESRSVKMDNLDKDSEWHY